LKYQQCVLFIVGTLKTVLFKKHSIVILNPLAILQDAQFS